MPTSVQSPSEASATNRCWRSRTSSIANSGTCSRSLRPRSEPVSPGTADGSEEKIMETVQPSTHDMQRPVFLAAASAFYHAVDFFSADSHAHLATVKALVAPAPPL